MATFKAIVSKYMKDDGTRNVMIYVFHNGKKRYPPTNYYLSKDDMTKSLKIKNRIYYDALDDMLRKCRKRCNDNASRLGDMTVDQVVELVKDIIQGNEDRAKSHAFDLDSVKYGRDHVEKLKKAGNSGNAKTCEIALNNLVKFVGRESVSIHEITAQFIKDWIQWIKELPAPPNRKKGGRAESLYPGNIRALHNLAKNEFNEEETGSIRIPLSPFKTVKLPDLPEARQRALTADEIRKISSLEDISVCHAGNNLYNFARDMFMLSFMLIGMNEVDLYNCDEYENGRITYRRTKVRNRRKDRGKISIRVEPEAIPLLEKYRDPTGERVFRFYRMYASVSTFTAAINGLCRKGAKGKRYATGLKKIGTATGISDLEFYAARHSWASIARNDLGIEKYTVHEALNHVDDAMKATDAYIKKDWAPIDRANRKVLDYLFYKQN
jgi:integrase